MSETVEDTMSSTNMSDNMSSTNSTQEEKTSANLSLYSPLPSLPSDLSSTTMSTSEPSVDTEESFIIFPKFSKKNNMKNRILLIAFLILTILFFHCRMIIFYLLFMILGIRSLFMSFPKEQGLMMVYAYTVIFILLGIYSGNRGVLFINSVVWVLLTLFLWKKQGAKKSPKISQRLQRHKVLLLLTLFFSTVFVIFSILVHKRTLTAAASTPCPPPKQKIKTLKKEKITSQKTNLSLSKKKL